MHCLQLTTFFNVNLNVEISSTLAFFSAADMDDNYYKHCALALSRSLTAFQGTHLIKIFTATEPCQILVPASFCYALRMPAVMCFDAHMTIHLSIVIERGIALRHLSTYESSTAVTGFALATFSYGARSSTQLQFISALGIAVYTMRKYDFDARTFYCSGATKDTMFEVSITSYSIVAFEAIIIVMFGCIYHLNVRRSNVYDVRAKYQAKENLVVLRLLIPVVFFHFLVFFFFMAANAIASSIRNIFPTDTAFRVYLAAVYVSTLSFCSYSKSFQETQSLFTQCKQKSKARFLSHLSSRKRRMEMTPPSAYLPVPTNADDCLGPCT
ncbi:hypothetical protein ANCCAN_24753 [Ancylostoma caninum]|uniref:G protein-coupled receptor n=1 Tax=Ancylostoma caninum TaxID=29170 RepID=A0A368FEP4_ANCCA|nr:hypothetical protein ANCCAN_24753 [Ancylostoma caninum]